MLEPRDETLIQRCVDGELSASERRELLDRLDAIEDGWKILACWFWEDQLLADAVTEPNVPPPKRATAQDRSGRSHWFHHPLTSLVLSICVAALTGLLVYGELQTPEQSVVTAADGAGSRPSQAQPSKDVKSGMAVSSTPDFHGQMEAAGMSPVDVPVYVDPQRYQSIFQEFQRQLNAASVSESGEDPEARRIQFFRFQTDDGKVIVVPFHEGAVPRFQ